MTRPELHRYTGIVDAVQGLPVAVILFAQSTNMTRLPSLAIFSRLGEVRGTVSLPLRADVVADLDGSITSPGSRPRRCWRTVGQTVASDQGFG
jgi:hypothetical protein